MKNIKEESYDKIKIHNLNSIPEGLSYMGGYEVSSLGNYDLKYLSGMNIDEIWYWYATAPYEGSGAGILRKGDLYAIEDLGHCSCYGPLEHINELNWKKLEDIKISKEVENRIQPLLDLIKDQ